MRRNWTEEELIVAFNLYCKISFGTIHHRNPRIVKLANLINRTPNAVALKLSNFASFDPELQERGIRGLQNASRKDAEIFDRFYFEREDLAFESEKLLADFENRSIEDKYEIDLQELEDFKGNKRLQYVKTRVNQSFFRSMLLANYEGKCAITGIDIQQMLNASHIIPWSKSKENRLNPSNGILLCTHFDSAFDKGLISFNSEYHLIINSSLREFEAKPYYNDWFKRYKGRKLNMPYKAKPRLEFLEWHRINFMIK